MTVALKNQHQTAIISILAGNKHVERAVLFGFRAMGTNTVTSDVDIALFGKRLTLTDQARLVAAVDQIPMAQSVDLILFDLLQNKALKNHILTNGIEWYQRGECTTEKNTHQSASDGHV